MSQTLPLTIRMHESDNVVIANVDVLADFEIEAEGLTTRDNIKAGHKIATQAIAAGQPVRRYGQVIGFASQNLEPGDHVHSHNLEFGDFDRDYAFGAETREVEMVADGEIGSVAAYHYAFMGATPPMAHAEIAKDAAAAMKGDHVDGVLLAGV